MNNSDGFLRFNTSESNYFYLSNMDRYFWRFYQDNEATSFYIIGNPHIEFRNIDISLIDRFSCGFADLGLKLLNADGLKRLMSTSVHQHYEFHESMKRCAKELKNINKTLSYSSATVSEEKMTQLIKDNEI